MATHMSMISKRCGRVTRHKYTIDSTRLMRKAGAALCWVSARADTRTDMMTVPVSVVCIFSKLPSGRTLSTLQSIIARLIMCLVLLISSSVKGLSGGGLIVNVTSAWWTYASRAIFLKNVPHICTPRDHSVLAV